MTNKTLTKLVARWLAAESRGLDRRADSALRQAFSELPLDVPPGLAASVMRRAAAAGVLVSGPVGRGARAVGRWAPGWGGQLGIAAWMVATFTTLSTVFGSMPRVAPGTVVSTALGVGNGVLQATVRRLADANAVWGAANDIVGALTSLTNGTFISIVFVLLAGTSTLALGALSRLLKSDRSHHHVYSH